MATAAERLMQKFAGDDILKDEDGAAAGGMAAGGGSSTVAGPTIAANTSVTNNIGGKGSVSQLGNPPDGPLRKKKKKHEHKVCRACGYPSISEALICPECGNGFQDEDYVNRQRAYRQNLIEGKEISENRVGWIPQAMDKLIRELKQTNGFDHLDENDQLELSARLEKALTEFVTWKSQRDYLGL